MSARHPVARRGAAQNGTHATLSLTVGSRDVVLTLVARPTSRLTLTHFDVNFLLDGKKAGDQPAKAYGTFDLTLTNGDEVTQAGVGITDFAAELQVSFVGDMVKPGSKVTVVARGVNAYTGELKATYTIGKASLSRATMKVTNSGPAIDQAEWGGGITLSNGMVIAVPVTAVMAYPADSDADVDTVTTTKPGVELAVKD